MKQLTSAQLLERLKNLVREEQSLFDKGLIDPSHLGRINNMLGVLRTRKDVIVTCDMNEARYGVTLNMTLIPIIQHIIVKPGFELYPACFETGKCKTMCSMCYDG